MTILPLLRSLAGSLRIDHYRPSEGDAIKAKGFVAVSTAGIVIEVQTLSSQPIFRAEGNPAGKMRLSSVLYAEELRLIGDGQARLRISVGTRGLTKLVLKLDLVTAGGERPLRVYCPIPTGIDFAMLVGLLAGS